MLILDMFIILLHVEAFSNRWPLKLRKVASAPGPQYNNNLALGCGSRSQGD